MNRAPKPTPRELAYFASAEVKHTPGEQTRILRSGLRALKSSAVSNSNGKVKRNG